MAGWNRRGKSTRHRAWAGSALALFAGSVLGCASSDGSDGGAPNPAGDPASLIRAHHAPAREQPCRYIGTLHRDSRSNLENLKSCGELSRAEWDCMTAALAEIDERFTLMCRTAPIAYEDFVRAQETEYATCLESDRPRTMEKALDLDVVKVRCD